MLSWCLRQNKVILDGLKVSCLSTQTDSGKHLSQFYEILVFAFLVLQSMPTNFYSLVVNTESSLVIHESKSVYSDSFTRLRITRLTSVTGRSIFYSNVIIRTNGSVNLVASA